MAGHAQGGIHGLYFGLGAYRIGEDDGGLNEDNQSQWCTGSALARQVEGLHSLGAGGWALYRYDSLFRSAQPELADAERAALAALTTGLNSCMEKQNAVYYINRVKPRVKTKFEDKRS